MLDRLLRIVSPLFMNQVSSYTEEYFIFNHLRHLNSFYGPLIKGYYRYLAYFCMAKPTGLPNGERVLDIGCGVGTLVSEFRKMGYDAWGVDVSRKAIKNSLDPKHCILVSTTAKLQFPNRYFDLIVSRESLEHIPEDEINDCIKEWGRVSKGKMVHIVAVTERGKSATEDSVHVNVKPEKWWIRKFNSHGYKVKMNPSKVFISPFGMNGYMMMLK